MARLTTPRPSIALDIMKVVAFKVEDNPASNTHWCEIWMVLGKMIGGRFAEYIDPQTGAEAQYLKIEDGRNPFDNSQALGRCSRCNEWQIGQTSGTCSSCGRTTVEPYDGWTRLNATGYSVSAIEAFLCKEETPHSDTGAVTRLLDADEGETTPIPR